MINLILLLSYIPILFELSNDVENAGLLSKLAKDRDVWIGDWLWLWDSSFKNSNLFGDDIFMVGVTSLPGFYK